LFQAFELSAAALSSLLIGLAPSARLHLSRQIESMKTARS
jgi:hypothetical protein